MRKGIVAMTVLIVFSAINVYFSTIVHKLLSKTFEGVRNLNFTECVDSIIQNKNHSVIFISVEIFMLLGITLLMLNRFGDYKSKMQQITPTIKTPTAAGQMQYGSSRWLKKKEYHKAFKTVIIDRNSQQIKYLLDCGKADFKEQQQYMKKQENHKEEIRADKIQTDKEGDDNA